VILLRIAFVVTVLAMAVWLPGSGANTVATTVAAQALVQPRVTVNEHVAPILFANCSGCRRPGEAALFPLLG
jgi:hypothetical protein